MQRTQHRLVCTATTSDNTNHATGSAVDNLLGTGGQLDTGLALIGVVADDGDVVARGTAQSATVTNLLLDVRDDGTLRHGAQGQDVADSQVGVLSSVDELASVHALVGNEGLGVVLESVGITEDDLGEGSTATSVVDDLLHNTTNVAMSLGVVESSELGGGLVEPRDGVEYRASALPLVSDNATHLDCLLEASQVCKLTKISLGNVASQDRYATKTAIGNLQNLAGVYYCKQSPE